MALIPTFLVSWAVFYSLVRADSDRRETMGFCAGVLLGILGVVTIFVVAAEVDGWTFELPRWLLASVAVLCLAGAYFAFKCVGYSERERRTRGTDVGKADSAGATPASRSRLAVIASCLVIAWLGAQLPLIARNFRTEHGECKVCGGEFVDEAGQVSNLGLVTGMAIQLPADAVLRRGLAPETEVSNVHESCFLEVRAQLTGFAGAYGLMGQAVRRSPFSVEPTRISPWEFVARRVRSM